MKSIILGLLLASMMFGEAVHFGPSSKVYHLSATCSVRKGAKAHKLTSERSVAEAHGLRECKRCTRAACTTDAECEKAAAAKKAKAGNGAWAAAAAAEVK
jgi:methylphosphotriester-DNA--protein-cysteine methyltransferase